MLLFKTAGLILILAASTLLGFSKAHSLKKRSLKLNSVCISLTKLAQLVRADAGELEGLFALSFEKDVLDFKGSSYEINKNFLEKSDILLMDNFLKEIGMADRETEYKRIEVFKNLFEKQSSEAEKRSGELSKLYNTLGFLVGLSICIFLI